jgi:hypothetical protein
LEVRVVKEHSDLRNLMITVLYGEADDNARRRLESALATDAELAAEFEELKETYSMVDEALAAEDPGEEFWNGVWPAFQRRLRAERNGKQQAGKVAAAWHWIWKPALQVAAVAVMLIIGILIGRSLSEREFTQNSAEQAEPQTGSTADTEGTQGRATPLTVSFPYDREIKDRKQDFMVDATRNSLEKTEAVLEDFLKVEPEQGSGHVRFVSESGDINTLLTNLATLRVELGEPEMGQLYNLLEEVELVLGDIEVIRSSDKELPPEEYLREVEFMKRFIEDSKLLVRIRQVQLPERSSRAARPAGFERVERVKQ